MYPLSTVIKLPVSGSNTRFTLSAFLRRFSIRLRHRPNPLYTLYYIFFGKTNFFHCPNPAKKFHNFHLAIDEALTTPVVDNILSLAWFLAK
jgi:hypothetical protein